MKTLFIIICVSLSISSCTIVIQGEVGVKRKLGKLKEVPYQPGVVGFNPLATIIIKVPIRTVNREVKLTLPSKEGLNIQAEISILYRIMPDKAPKIVETIGMNYEDVVIISVFRSAAADVCSQFYAKDMHTAERAHIEKEIAKLMTSILEPRGFVIEAVLLKSIVLPPNLSKSIELKLQAEQEAQQMEFVLQKEKLEAERKRIEAEGISNSQKIISEGLTDQILKYNTIQAFEKLSTSDNTKIIITDGNAPLLIDAIK